MSATTIAAATMEARLIGPAFGAPFSEGEKSVRARRETHWNWQDNSFAWACPRKDERRFSDGLGPLFNAQSCRECHQNPVSGGATQVLELRFGHRGPDGLVLYVPIVEAPGQIRVGRFGWKDQQASLVSFRAMPT